MSIGVPIKLLHEAENHIITCELKSGELYRGYLMEAEDYEYEARRCLRDYTWRQAIPFGLGLCAREQSEIFHYLGHAQKFTYVQENI